MSDLNTSAPPESWTAARRIARGVLAPIERFLHVEAASGVLLLVAAAAAFALANSGWAHAFEAIWHAPVVVGIGPFLLTEPLHFWINEVLMTVFFLNVGLEIRREIHEGELADWRRAALPVAAAIGGMAAPALLYCAFNAPPDLRRGWGTPTATDIAFAVGVLALLGKRVPPALRVMLLALAIIDDIGGILIIALFYSDGVHLPALLISVAGVGGILAFKWFGARRAWLYVFPSALVWLGLWRAGVHPTISGVLVGLLTPVRSWLGRHRFLDAPGGALKDFQEYTEREAKTEKILRPLRRIGDAHREALAPAVRLQAQLHPWVAFGIMPLFALANAGVAVGGLELDERTAAVATGTALGLVLGKPVGILAGSLIAVRLGLARLPRGVTWSGVLLVGCVGGIGFTMALFIANLAFADPDLLSSAKLGVLVGSAVAGVVGLALGRFVLVAHPSTVPWAPAAQAEASAEE